MLFTHGISNIYYSLFLAFSAPHGKDFYELLKFMYMERKMLYLSLIFLSSGIFLGFIAGKSVSLMSLRHVSLSLNHNVVVNYTEVVFPLVAVTSEEKGVLEYATLKILPGSGKMFIQINPFVEPDTQYAFESAIKSACNVLHKDCSKYDFMLNIHSNATLVGGPSAGLAFALATYYGLLNKTFPPYVAATGTINSKGEVGPVGGIFEKALAAAKAGKKLFLVPPGQSIVYRYEKVEKRYEPFPGFVFVQIEYKPAPVNLTKLFWEKYKMRIVEVRTLEEAVKVIEKVRGT